MIETRLLKNVVFFSNNFKFCAVKKDYNEHYANFVAKSSGFKLVSIGSKSKI